MPNFGRKTLIYCYLDGSYPPPPPPPPPPTTTHHHSSLLKVVMLCALAVTVFLVCCISIIKACRIFRKTGTSHGNNINETHQDFVDEERGSVVFHPIWFINTIGLEQSVIDSIGVFKYKKGNGFIDGSISNSSSNSDSDCAVCLGEFQDEETLRILPKCGHAFHVSCIDTWLRSHKNCPVCRAPVVKNTIDAQIESSRREEIPIGDLRNETQTPQEIDSNGENLENKCLFRVRVQSDLTDRRRQEPEPIRRSVSMVHLATVNGDQESKNPNELQKSTKCGNRCAETRGDVKFESL